MASDWSWLLLLAIHVATPKSASMANSVSQNRNVSTCRTNRA